MARRTDEVVKAYLETTERYSSMSPEEQEKRFGYRLRGDRFVVPVGKIRPNAWNPNTMDEKQFDALGKAIANHGFMGHVTVRYQNDEGSIPEGEFEIVDGEHRQSQVLALAGQDPEAPVPVLAIEAPDHEAQLLTVVYNETVGRADKVDLSRLLASLAEGGHYSPDELGDVLPYAPGELDEMIALAAHAWDDYGDGDGNEEGTDGGDAGGDGGDFVTVAAAFTEEDFEAVESVRRRIADVQALSGDEPVRWGQVFHALAAEYLAGNPDEGSGA